MAGHTKPAPWALSPELTEAPELWRNIQFLVPMWERTGTPKNLALGAPPVSSPNGQSWVTTGEGPACTFNGSDQYLNLGDIPIVRNLTTWARFIGPNDSDAMVLSKFEADQYNNDAHVPYIDGTGSYRVDVGRTGTLEPDVEGNYTVGSITDVIVSHADDGVSGSLTVYDGNGRVVGSNNSGVLFDNGEPWLVATDPDASGAGALANWFNGIIMLVAGWNETFTQEKVKRLTQDPYAMLRPRQDLFIAPVLLGGAETSGGGSGGGGGIGTGSPQVNVIL